MSISEIKHEAKVALSGKWGLAILPELYLFLLNFIPTKIFEIYYTGGFSKWVDHEGVPLPTTIFGMALSFLLVPVTVSTSWLYLGISRYEKPRILEIFLIYKEIKIAIKFIFTSIVITVFTLLWSILLIIPGIIRALSYSQTFFLLKDHPEYSVLEAINESKIRMKGFKTKLFLLNLSFIGWGILCIFTLGIGILWLAPYISTSLATFYNELIYPQSRNHDDMKEQTI
ncbi:DUF975 family protein [Peribacillus alkalitolerans]|uniref:DUF975 family protein n=1 Tax=Peribacillus alkalitolerans TaxID=1550385 RepID=UPI0013D2C3C5|nr:DUF975 family protein [Peribacillus alkalitolerans]